MCNLTSKLPKVAVHSPAGDLSAITSDIPGSHNHPTASQRIACSAHPGVLTNMAPHQRFACPRGCRGTHIDKRKEFQPARKVARLWPSSPGSSPNLTAMTARFGNLLALFYHHSRASHSHTHSRMCIDFEAAEGTPPHDVVVKVAFFTPHSRPLRRSSSSFYPSSPWRQRRCRWRRGPRGRCRRSHQRPCHRSTQVVAAGGRP